MIRRNRSEGMDAASEMSRSKIQLRISAAAPLCGIFAVLAQGITDYAWYNYRLYLMFWLVCGLASAYVRNGSTQIRNSYPNTSYRFSADFHLEPKPQRKRGRPKKNDRPEPDRLTLETLEKGKKNE